MPSIKCKQCNLVNFSTEVQCRRCGNSLGGETASFAQQHQSFPANNVAQSYQTQPLDQTALTNNLGQNRQSNQYQTNYGQRYPNEGYRFQTPPSEEQNYQPPPFQGYQKRQPPPVFYAHLYQPQAVYSTCIKCGDYRDTAIRKFKRDYVPPVAYLGFFAGGLIGVILVSMMRVRHEISATFCHRCWNNFASVSWVEGISMIGFVLILIAAIVAGVASSSLFVFFLVFGVAVAAAVAGAKYKKKHSPIFKRINRHEVIITDPVNGELSFNF